MILLEVNIFYQSLQRSFYILLTRHLLSRILLFNQNQTGQLTDHYNFEVEQTIPKGFIGRSSRYGQNSFS
jgi:hypothetical protein